MVYPRGAVPVRLDDQPAELPQFGQRGDGRLPAAAVSGKPLARNPGSSVLPDRADRGDLIERWSSLI